MGTGPVAILSWPNAKTGWPPHLLCFAVAAIFVGFFFLCFPLQFLCLYYYNSNKNPQTRGNLTSLVIYIAPGMAGLNNVHGFFAR